MGAELPLLDDIISGLLHFIYTSQQMQYMDVDSDVALDPALDGKVNSRAAYIYVFCGWGATQIMDSRVLTTVSVSSDKIFLGGVMEKFARSRLPLHVIM